MRIGQIIGRTHRDDGAAFYIKKALIGMGHEVERVYVEDHPKGWEGYDHYLMVDWGGDCFPDKPDPEYPENTTCWLSDTHWFQSGYDYRLAQARKCMSSAICQLHHAHEFHEKGVRNAAWLPHAVDHTVYTPLLKDYSNPDIDHLPPDPAAWEGKVFRAVPRYDLGWVGHIGDPKREQVLEAMFKAIPNFIFRTGLFFRDAARLYNYSKLVFNISVRGELNMRTFEAMATRSALLTDRQAGMDMLGLRDGENCIIYDTVDEAIDKAKYYLDHDYKRMKIADAGYEFVLKKHTYQHRAKALLDIMEKCGRVST